MLKSYDEQSEELKKLLVLYESGFILEYEYQRRRLEILSPQEEKTIFCWYAEPDPVDQTVDEESEDLNIEEELEDELFELPVNNTFDFPW